MCWNTRFRERKIMFVLSTISVARTNEPIKTTEPKPRLISIKKVHIIISLVGAVCTQSALFCLPIKHRAICDFPKNSRKTGRSPIWLGYFHCECTEIMHWAHYKWIYNGSKEKKKKKSSKCWQMNWIKLRNFWCIVYVYRVPIHPIHKRNVFVIFGIIWPPFAMDLWVHLWSIADVRFINIAYAKRFLETG